MKTPASLRNLGAALVLAATLQAQQPYIAVTNYVVPFYPPLASQARIEGDVLLKLEIGPDGIVRSMTVSSGHPMLQEAAMKAARQWRFACHGCQAEASFQHSLRFTFRLSKEVPRDDERHQIKLPDHVTIIKGMSEAIACGEEWVIGDSWFHRMFKIRVKRHFCRAVPLNN